MNITIEIRNFISAWCSGIFLFSTYYALEMVRKKLPHAMWLINMEDVIFWGITLAYLFVQIYHTNDGIIRGYYILGLVLGAVFSWKTFRISVKMWNNFVHFKKEKSID